MSRPLLAAVGATLVAGAVACSGSSAPPTAQPTQSTAVPTPSSTPPAPPAEATLAFAGDTHFVGASARALDGFGPIAAYLQRADLAMVNLESAVTLGGTAVDKEFVFRSPPQSFAALKAAGIDVVTEANNHGEDYGVVGLEDSLRYADDAHYPVVGIGRDSHAAFAPYRTTIHGLRIAIVGATDVIDSKLIGAWTATASQPGLASAKDRDTLIRKVRHLRRTSDVVVVYLHWGSELVNCPTAGQRDLAASLLLAGADVVVGSHAHVLLGGGWHGTAYVDYGLGNFVFYSAGGVTARTGVLTLTVQRHSVVDARWRPAVINSGIPFPLTGAAARAARTDWRALRPCTGLAPQPG